MKECAMILFGKSLGLPRIALLGLATGLLMAQGQTVTPAPPPAPKVDTPKLSWAELAQQVRAADANRPKAKHVYTNDTLPHTSTLSVVGPTPEAPAEATDADKTDDKTGNKAADKKADKDKDKANKEDEGVWRAKFAGLRQNLDTEQRRLDVLQREFNLAQLQSYSDPNQAMREQFARTEINKRQADIDAQKQVVAAAQKALDDALEDARKKGIPPGWTAPK
jgi:hypothetical protein